MTGIEKVSGMIILAILYGFMSGAGMFELREKLSGLSVMKFLH